MALKKRLSAFVSNWLGVIIAAIIVLISVSFGGMYLYGRSRLDNSINFVTQVIYMRYQDGLTLTGTTENPSTSIFHLVLQVYNPYEDPIDVAVSDITLSADSYSFNISQDGSWNKTVATGYETFEGNFTIDKATYEALAAEDPVDIEIKGTISGSGHYKWISRQIERQFDIPVGVSFQYK